MVRGLLIALSLVISACGGTESPVDDAGTAGPDAGTAGPDAALTGPDAAAAGPDAATVVDKAAACASTFGTALTNGFGRLDGTVHAIVEPTDQQCAMPNSTHLVLQVQANGAVYRMVARVVSDGRNGTDTKMRYAEVPHALLGEPWSEGWHLGVALDYPGDLGAHTDSTFTPYEMNALIEKVSSRLNLGEKVSVYSVSKDRPESTHLIHRNQNTAAADDGAIVVGPTSAQPLYLLFHWDGLVF